MAAARTPSGEAARGPGRGGVLGAALGLLAAAPVAVLLLAGIGPGELALASARGLRAEIDSVGFVLVPQLALAIGILGLALQQGVRRGAGLPRLAPPHWLSPAVESALLLGLLGTISGMVSGFVGVSPAELEPAPLIRGLGAALRSTFVGFAIALVGVWLQDETPTPLEAGGAASFTAGKAASFTVGGTAPSAQSLVTKVGEGSPAPPRPPRPPGRPGTRT